MAKVLLLVIIGSLAILRWGDVVWLFLKRKMILRSFKKGMRIFARTIMRRTPTIEEIAGSMFEERENYQGDDPERQATAFHYRLLRALRNTLKPNKKEVRRLYELGKLKAVNPLWLPLYPDAVYELRGIGDEIIFFRKNLSIAGFKNYHPDVEKILINVFEQKCLLPRDVEFLRYVVRIHEVEEWGKRKRYSVREQVLGNSLHFVFNENFDLIVVTKYDEVVWKLPGARQPELYQ